MSVINRQSAKESHGVPKIVIGVLVGVLISGMFVVGYDQGHLFSVVRSEKAFDELWLHDFFMI